MPRQRIAPDRRAELLTISITGKTMEYLLHHHLSRNAARQPARPAVVMNDVTLTYQDLDRQSNQLARALTACGVERGDRVGLYVHKSPASVIGVYGIMKTGAAYVPLDPNAPAKRLAYITRDCGIRVLVTSGAKCLSLAEFFADGTPVARVVLTDEAADPPPMLPPQIEVRPWAAVEREDGGALPLTGSIDRDLAYILYTSGSTGVPKGVMISHRTIRTFIDWACEEFALTAEDRVTSCAPLHFDLSTFDLYATIQAGATIVLVGENLAALPVKLADLLETERVTVTYLVPSILSFMANYGKLEGRDWSRLRSVLFAGEVFPIKFLRRLAAAVPHAAYYNLYGPTETNVCTYYRVRPEDLSPERTQPVPIGQACANMEVFALDNRGERVTEPGREGELWARGACVAQGYWGDPEKTARAFVQSPLNPLYPDPAYRTGDIVTLAPDRRNWIYVSRVDHMIKSRGYRIELGEIESALYRHEQVKEAAALAVPDELLGNRIHAFVVLAERGSLSAKELEAFCALHLPKYMIPERIEFRDLLPKTSSGKIDRAALVARRELVGLHPSSMNSNC